jgi:hypothetical protein
LSSYSAKDFSDASRYSGVSASMRDALHGLAREAGSGGPGSSTRETGLAAAGADQTRHRKAKNGALAHDGDAAKSAEEFFTMLRHSAHFENKRSILAFSNEIGLDIQSRPKESKEKLARRVSRALDALPLVVRKKATELLRAKAKSQTEGWIDVIQNASR